MPDNLFSWCLFVVVTCCFGDGYFHAHDFFVSFFFFGFRFFFFFFFVAVSVPFFFFFFFFLFVVFVIFVFLKALPIISWCRFHQR